MNDAWDFDETVDDVNSGPKPLRDAYKAQKQRNDELMQRLAKLEERDKANQVRDLFESQGVPRSAARYYNGDATEDAVTAFVNDMRTTFGGAAQQSAPVVPTTPAVNDADIQKLQSLMQAGAGSDVTAVESAAYSKMNDPSISQAERIAAFAELARKLQ